MSICEYEDDWRPDCSGLGFTDELFVVGKEKTRIFHVHKKILSSESKMFEKLFSDDSTEEKGILKFDDDPILFEMLLNHFYDTPFTITDLTSLWKFYKLGKKYEVPGILSFAKYQFKSIGITEADFWEIIECGLFSHPFFADKTLEYIAENADDIINSEKIFTVPEELIDIILQMDALNIVEYDLLLAVTEWGYRNIDQVNSEKMRKLYKHIRFGTLRSDQMRTFYDCYSEAIDRDSIKGIFWYLHSISHSSLPHWCSKNHVVRKLEFKRQKRMMLTEISEADEDFHLLE